MKTHQSILSTTALTMILFLATINGFSQPLNNYLEFDGADDYVDLGNSTVLKPTTALTVELWAYNTNWSTLDNSRFISNTQNGGYNMDASSGYLKAFVNLNGTYYTPNVALSSLGSGWHHFALTCDGQYSKLYVDGVLKDTKDAGAVYPIQYAATANSTLLAAEAGSTSTPWGGYFDGVLDEVRIWNLALSQTHIQDSMNVHINPASAGLAGYWRLNETSGTTAADETVNANDGTLVNMAGSEWITIFTAVSNSLIDINFSSVAWGDYDNDGYLDILLTGSINNAGGRTSKVYKNNGDGTFTEQTGISLTR